MLGGLFESKSKSVSTTQTIAKDERIDVGGMSGGTLASPASQITQPGSVGMHAGDYSNISATIKDLQMGMTGAEVKELVSQTAEAFKGTTQGVLDYAKSAIQSTQAAQTGGLGDIQRYIPLVVVGLVVVAIWRARK